MRVISMWIEFRFGVRERLRSEETLNPFFFPLPTAYSRQFEVGTLYTYVYETSVLLNEPQALPVSTAKDVGFRVELSAEVTPVWQHPGNAHEQILQLTVKRLFFS